MRVIVFFDLPVVSKKDRKVYARFRKWLLSSGYTMLQYSVYSKIFNNRDSAKKHISKLKKNVPSKGAVRVMMVTEKQYAKMEILVGGKSLQEEEISTDPLIIL